MVYVVADLRVTNGNQPAAVTCKSTPATTCSSERLTAGRLVIVVIWTMCVIDW